jgi:hypothetical protein
MEEILATLKAIPAAATSPLALVAYLATVGAWTLIAWRVRRHSILVANIDKFPAADRKAVIGAELGHVDVPEGLSAEQFLRARIHGYVFMGWIALCITTVVVVATAFYKRNDKKDRADAYIREFLDSPSSTYMSSVNTLANGRQMISDAAGDVAPQLSKQQLDDLVERLVRQGMNGTQIDAQLKQVSGTDRLGRTNQAVLGAAATVDKQYGKLAECFRSSDCEPGSQFARMCTAVRAIKANVDALNEAARKIPGASINASGAPTNFGDGSMDITFNVVFAKTVNYLVTDVCGTSNSG